MLTNSKIYDQWTNIRFYLRCGIGTFLSLTFYGIPTYLGPILTENTYSSASHTIYFHKTFIFKSNTIVQCFTYATKFSSWLKVAYLQYLWFFYSLFFPFIICFAFNTPQFTRNDHNYIAFSQFFFLSSIIYCLKNTIPGQIIRHIYTSRDVFKNLRNCNKYFTLFSKLTRETKRRRKETEREIKNLKQSFQTR